MHPAAENLAQLVELVKREGATAPRLIAAKDVVVNERVRLKCQVPLCPDFGRALMCPPDCPPWVNSACS